MVRTNGFRQVIAKNLHLEPLGFNQELAMQAYLMLNPDILQIDDNNFTDPEILQSEYSLSNGRKGRDGRADIIVKYSSGYWAIAELKKQEINLQTLQQLKEYLQQRTQIENDLKKEEDDTIQWAGILIGTSIHPELISRIENNPLLRIGSEEIPIAAMTLSRFKAKTQELFVIADTYYKEPNTRDFTKYVFNSKPRAKNRLVLEVVSQYKDDKDPTYTELEKAFPKHLQKTFGVFTTREEAEEIHSRTGTARHFIKENEILVLKDNTEIAVCNQWGKDNVPAFVEHAKRLGYEITKA